jgi:hypothetical protein
MDEREHILERLPIQGFTHLRISKAEEPKTSTSIE